jgi:hypothetical protein
MLFVKMHVGSAMVIAHFTKDKRQKTKDKRQKTKDKFLRDSVTAAGLQTCIAAGGWFVYSLALEPS